jgi:hypothetical protein
LLFEANSEAGSDNQLFASILSRILQNIKSRTTSALLQGRKVH